MIHAFALVGETVLLGVWLASLFHQRRLAGSWPFYLSVVMLQPIGLLLGPLVYVDLPFGISGNPGTLVVFPANLFVVLLVYVREDALQVRRLLLGLLGANLTFTLLWFVFGLHVRLTEAVTPASLVPITRIPTPVLLLSASLLLVDALLAIRLFEGLSRRLRLPLFARLWLVLALVLTFDQLAFGSALYFGRADAAHQILAGLAGKWLFSGIYAGILAGYLSYAAAPAGETSIPPNPRGGFAALTYRQRYEAARSETRRALARRDAILESVGFAAERFLMGGAWEDNIDRVLARLGQATDASRVYLFENRVAGEAPVAALRFEWAKDGVSRQLGGDGLGLISYEAGLESWRQRLQAGEVIRGRVADLREAEAAQLRRRGTVSIALVPVLAGEHWWGFMGFDDCEAPRHWSQEELAALAAAASTLGAAIQRASTLAALRESEQRYRLQMEHAPEAIVVLDAEAGHLIEANYNAERLFKMPRERLLQKSPADLSPPHQPDGRSSQEAAADWARVALTGEAPSFEWVCRDADGEDKICEVRLVALPAGNRRLVRGSVTDVSDRRRLDEQLRQAQKMEGVGRLAGGIAHDFNNLLTAVLGYVTLARQALTPGAPAQRYLDEIKRAAERAADLTRQLLAFARKQVVEPQVLDMNDVTASMAPLLERLIGEQIRLETQPFAGAVRVKADRSQLEQVLLNLAVNARDAMPAGGLLRLQAEPCRLDAAAVRGRDGVAAGDYVLLSVTDTGHGMDEEVRRRAFEPFYTTKGVGKGTGLGLSTCEGIVAQSGGFIDVESEPGRGSCFRIYLPATQAATLADATATAPDATPAGGGSETVLVVEDDALVRAVTVDTLASLGYRVLEASDGQAALDLLAGEARVQLVITDVVMPRLGGRALLERLRFTRPELPVLLVSGYGHDIADADGALSPGTAFLPKPFTTAALADKVRELLHARASSAGRQPAG